MNIRITRELLDDLNMRIGMGHDVSVEIPYAQAEIDKRDERIESLTSAGAEYQRQCFEQAAEIVRLRALVGKCKAVIEQTPRTTRIDWKGIHTPDARTHLRDEALAAIKEKGL